MKWRQLEVHGGSCIGAWPTCLWPNTTTSCLVWWESIIFSNIKRSQDFSFEWNCYKTSISGNCECTTGPCRVDKWAFSHLPLVNKGRERKKKANRQLYRHFLSVGQGVYPTTTSWGDAFKLKTSQVSYKCCHKETLHCSNVSLQPGRSKSTT